MSARLPELIKHIDTAIEKAEDSKSKCPHSVLYDIHGMSSYKTRAFMNNLANIPGGTYLEIGSWKGSTFISSCYDNQLGLAISIEDWSQPHGQENFKDDFYNNMLTYADHMPSLRIIDESCWAVNPAEIGPVDLYFYDGDHSEASQARALTHFKDCITEDTIVIVDDWDFVSDTVGRTVEPGTRRGIEEAGFEILHEKIIPTGNDWWFGFGIFILKRK